MDTTELVGYIAMAFLVVSFLPKQIRKIRLINFIGCSLFVLYGILLGWKWPLIVSNGLIALIQIYYLFIAKNKVVDWNKIKNFLRPETFICFRSFCLFNIVNQIQRPGWFYCQNNETCYLCRLKMNYLWISTTM